jgi:hypothetical protein
MSGLPPFATVERRNLMGRLLRIRRKRPHCRGATTKQADVGLTVLPKLGDEAYHWHPVVHHNESGLADPKRTRLTIRVNLRGAFLV